MSYIGICKLLGLSEKQLKMVTVGGIALLLSLFFMFWSTEESKFDDMQVQAKQKNLFVFTGDFPETLNAKRRDVMVIENFEKNEFDHYIFMKDLNMHSLVNWQKNLPEVNAWFIDENNNKINISKDVSVRDGKMVIYFSTTKVGQNTSWKYKGGRFIVSMNIVSHGFKLEW